MSLAPLLSLTQRPQIYQQLAPPQPQPSYLQLHPKSVRTLNSVIHLPPRHVHTARPVQHSHNPRFKQRKARLRDPISSLETAQT